MEIDARDVATARSHRLPHRAHRSLWRAHWSRLCAVIICALSVVPSGTIWHSRSGVLLVRSPQLQHPRMAAGPRAPNPFQIATSFSSACGQHTDPYGWLRDDSRTDPKVLSHLRAENAYAAAQLASLEPLQQQLHQELQASLPPVHRLPLKQHAGWLYYDQRAHGQQYADIFRVPSPAGGNDGYAVLVAAQPTRSAQLPAPVAPATNGTAAAPLQPPPPVPAAAGNHAPQLVLSRNQLAVGQPYFDLYRHAVSPAGWVAYLVDLVGDEQYRLQIADIASGRRLLPQPLPGCSGDLLWSSDGSTCWVTAQEGRVLAVQLTPSNGAAAAALGQTPVPPPAGQQAPPGAIPSTEAAALGESASLAAAVGAGWSQLANGRQDTSPAAASATPGGPAAPTAAAAAGGGNMAVTVFEVYQADPDEFISSMHATTDGQYIVLKSKIEGNGHVHVLDVASTDLQAPTSSPAPTTNTNTSSSRTAQGASGGVPYSIQERVLPWQLLLPWSKEVDVLGVDHAGNGTFLLLVDSDAAPDGQLLAVASGGGGGQAASSSKAVLLTSALSNATHNSSSSSSSSPCNIPAEAPPSTGHLGNSSNASNASRAADVGAGDSTSLQPAAQPQLPLEVVDFLVATSHLVVLLRVNCSCRVWVYDLPPGAGPGGTSHSGDPGDTWAWLWQHHQSPSSTADLLGEPDWDIPFQDATLVVSLEALLRAEGSGHALLTLHVTNLVTPLTIIECDLVTHTQTVRYVQPVFGGFQQRQYNSELVWATSADGVQVPMTVAWRKDLLTWDGHNPALLKGYGAYGSTQWPTFSPSDLLLLDRGWVLAVAHIRGGGELGSRWHRAGKGLHKKATFQDLLAAAGRLVELRYTSRQRLALWGRSAGGLAVGAALNMDPSCCGAALLDVPFLDVLGDMCDEGQLLTHKERAEWGDPLNDQVACEYIASYSPYQNLRPRPAQYPQHMLLTASLQDKRVNYWEPLKYVARMRELHGSDKQQVLMMTDEHAGHFAASQADAQQREELQKFAFLLHAFGA